MGESQHPEHGEDKPLAGVRPAREAWATDKTKLEVAAALCELGIAAGPVRRLP